MILGPDGKPTDSLKLMRQETERLVNEYIVKEVRDALKHGPSSISFQPETFEEWKEKMRNDLFEKFGWETEMYT